jgi:hypothetical protein
MKKLLFILVLTSVSINMQAQLYHLNVSQNTYTDLVGSTSLNNGATWNDPSYTIPIGFNFKLYNTTLSAIYINSGGTGSLLTSSPNTTGVVSLIQPFSTDIIDKGHILLGPSSGSLSKISYKTEGVIGNRILKIEWNNCGIIAGFTGSIDPADFVNFQLWLYETSNNIEIRYGTSLITNPAIAFDGDTGPTAAIVSSLDLGTDTISGEAIFLYGNTSNPSISNAFTGNQFLNGIPQNGTTYTFTTLPSLSVNEFDNDNAISFSPNPVIDFFNVENKNSNLEIKNITVTDAVGKVVKNCDSEFKTIDTSYLSQGIYQVEISSNLGQIHKRIIKN